MVESIATAVATVSIVGLFVALRNARADVLNLEEDLRVLSSRLAEADAENKRLTEEAERREAGWARTKADALHGIQEAFYGPPPKVEDA